MVENMALDNPAFERAYSTPVMLMESPQPVQQLDPGFGNLRSDPGAHCCTLDNVNKRPDNSLYVRLRHTLRMGPLQPGSRDHNFPKQISYIMGYNLKNSRNGKGISKISKWLSLRSLALKSKFVRQFEVLENLDYI